MLESVQVPERAELVERMRESATRARLLRATTGPVAPAGWPPHIIIGHLVYVEQNVWQVRLREMAVADLPTWQWWEPTGVDWQGLYGHRTWQEMVDEFIAVRAETADYLEGLDEAGWDRRARHEVFGEITVAAMCEEILTHDHEHLRQVAGG